MTDYYVRGAATNPRQRLERVAVEPKAETELIADPAVKTLDVVAKSIGIVRDVLLIVAMLFVAYALFRAGAVLHDLKAGAL